MSVQVTMLQTRLGEDGTLWLAGQTKTATDAFARLLVSSNLATATFQEVPQSSLTAAQVAALLDLVGDHGENVGWGVTSWYAGELASAVTPVITADGDLTSATDQVPLYWRVITNPPPYDPGVTLVDDVEAAQRLLDGAPNVITVSPGQTVVIELDEDLVAVYAICISTATERPADYTGGANIISGAGSTLADVLAATGMSRLDFSASPAKRVVLLQATQVYGTNHMKLMISGGVRS